MPINKWVLRTYLSDNNKKVFDGGVGSQGSRKAAYEFGCDFYGCENNENIYSIGEVNFRAFLEKVKSNYSLF